MTFRTIICGLAALSVTACGGSGGSDVSHDISVSALDARLDRLDDVFLDDVTPNANLPTTGSSSYSGVAVVATGDGDTTDFLALGAATMTADFGSQTITGSADNFYQSDDPNADNPENFSGDAISGSLTFSLQQDVVGENGYIGSAEGELLPTDLDAIDIDVPVGGVFAGDNAEAFLALGGDDETGIVIVTEQD